MFILSRILGLSTLAHALSTSYYFVIMVIGVAGAKGSFSEEAARKYAKKYLGNKPYFVEYLVTSEKVLSELEKGKINLGIFPIQNSTMGVVEEVVYAMSRHIFKVQRIFSILISQNLMVKKGMSSKDVKQIVSQEPALLQCKKFLSTKWKKTPKKNYSDTAKAAEDLALGVLPKNSAVVASQTAAKLYGLKIIARNIQDLKSNATSFIAAER